MSFGTAIVGGEAHLSAEESRKQTLDPGYPGRATADDDAADVRLGETTVREHRSYRLESRYEEIATDELKLAASERGIKVDLVKERVDDDACVRHKAEGALGPLAGVAQT